MEQVKKGFYKWELMIWLWLAFFLNQADRQIFNVVLPAIKDDLGLSDTQLGLVSSLFVLTIGVFIPIAGFAGDIFSRKKIIVISVFFWSLSTVFTGMSYSLIHLILFRSLAVGGGEAFYAPAANALIGQYHQKTRALAMSIHQTSLYFGVIVSGLLGGFIAERYGWHYAFFIFGFAGILIAFLIAWRLKKTPVMQHSVASTNKWGFLKESSIALFKKPTAILLGLAFACLVFVNVGYLTWMPTFLHEDFGLSLAEAGFSSMFYHHVFAFFGIICGGLLSDQLALKNKKKRLVIQCLGLLFGAPFIYFLGGASTATMAYVFLGGFGFFRGIYEANLYASLFDVIEPEYRSTSVGIISMFAFVTGALSPVILGFLKPTVGLQVGISILSIAYLAGAVFIYLALKFFFDRDSALKRQETAD